MIIDLFKKEHDRIIDKLLPLGVYSVPSGWAYFAHPDTIQELIQEAQLTEDKTPKERRPGPPGTLGTLFGIPVIGWHFCKPGEVLLRPVPKLPSL